MSRSALIATALALGILAGCTPPEPVTGYKSYLSDYTDKFDGHTYTRSDFFPFLLKDDELASPFSVSVFREKESNPRLTVHYRSSQWFFLESIQVKCSNGQIHTLTGKVLSREVVGTSVEEYVSFNIPPFEFEEIAGSNSLEVRFSGAKIDSVDTRFVHANFIWAMRQMVSKIKGKPFDPTPDKSKIPSKDQILKELTGSFSKQGLSEHASWKIQNETELVCKVTYALFEGSRAKSIRDGFAKDGAVTLLPQLKEAGFTKVIFQGGSEEFRIDL